MVEFNDRRPEFKEQGPSPLDYSESSYLHPNRFALVDPEAGEPHSGDVYFAEQRRQTYRGPTGRKLKNPREKVTPGAAPGTVAFADVTRPSEQELYINYMKVRPDRQGQGLGHEIVRQLIERHNDVSHINFGKMMHENVGHIMERVEEEYPEKRFHGKVYY
jgi:RimJ/RimL family protein N-acetyltransferase